MIFIFMVEEKEDLLINLNQTLLYVQKKLLKKTQIYVDTNLEKDIN